MQAPEPPVTAVKRRALAGKQRGVTLIEILVAIVLLSIGLLGLAGLQLRGMQVNQGSALRSQAAILAGDLADRMRADVAAANPANTTGSFYGAFTPASWAGASPPSMQDWLRSELGTLPAGVAAQAVPCNGNQLPCVHVWTPAPVGTLPTPVQIDVFWNDARASAAATSNATSLLGQFTIVTGLSSAY
ncbi:putative pre-pilin leader sequence [Burkholderiales bacterium]|nr:putative pre-pilin leader sequence [Burkholderiales bacterium]